MLTGGEQISIGTGVVFGVLGLLVIFRALVDAARFSRVVGEEFLVYAEVGTFVVGGKAFKIKQSKIVAIAFLLAALLIVGYQHANATYGYIWIAGWLMLFGCLRGARQLTPACIIVLGRSAGPTILLQTNMNLALAPFRAISLLESKEVNELDPIAADCFRVGRGQDWVVTVDALCAYMPLIVLDLRESTEFVEVEIDIIIKKDFLFKTVFLIPEEGVTQVISRAHEMGINIPPEKFFCVPEPIDCVEAIRKLLLIDERTPSREHPLMAQRD